MNRPKDIFFCKIQTFSEKKGQKQQNNM